MEIYVIRHTRVCNPDNLCYGQSDISLTHSFDEEVIKIAEKLNGLNFDKIFCSPIERCALLAKSLFYEDIFYEPRLKEMNFGKWEGKSWNEIDRKELDDWSANYVEIRPPEGENLKDLSLRAEEFLLEIQKSYGKNQKILLVTHAGIIRCIWAHILQIPLNHIFKIPIDFNELFVFNWHPEYGYRIIQKK